MSRPAGGAPEADSVAALVAGLRSGRLEPRAVMADHLRRIDAGRDLNAFLWAESEPILAATSAPGLAARPLGGLPVALKDNIDTAGIPTTAGSLVDRDRVPESDAPAWRRLRDAGGACLLGKAHMCEFAYRAHHPAFGWARNPRRADRATGGSSSGSAAAVGAGMAPAALGTDTGGSVRIPAAYCGVVGLKGTYGIVENDGVVPLSTTMDHVGVLARSVSDAAIVFEQMTARPVALVEPATLRVRPAEPGRLRVGLERRFFLAGAQPAVVDAWSAAAAALRGAGCEMVELSLPRARRWRSAHRTILIREAWDYHAARLRAGAPYGPVFRTAVSTGAEITDADLARALAVRDEAIDELASVFDQVDVILTPTCPTVAPPREVGLRHVTYSRYTFLAAFTGLPAISIPAGTGLLGLPIGAQLIAAADADATVVASAALLEDLLAPVGRASAG